VERDLGFSSKPKAAARLQTALRPHVWTYMEALEPAIEFGAAMIVRVRREVPDQQRDQRHRRDGGHRK
jgi:hypothetical protein